MVFNFQHFNITRHAAIRPWLSKLAKTEENFFKSGVCMRFYKIRMLKVPRDTGSCHLPDFLCLNFFITTHSLGCSLFKGGGGMQNIRYEGSYSFSKYLRVTPLSRGNGNGTNYNRGSRSLNRSSVKKEKKKLFSGIKIIFIS
jgi:hypothetical protein